MTVKEIINFLKKHKVKHQDCFDTIFEAGHYSEQDISLEETYGLDNGLMYTIVDDKHRYAYIDVTDESDNIVYDEYITFKSYEKLIKMLKKEG